MPHTQQNNPTPHSLLGAVFSIVHGLIGNLNVIDVVETAVIGTIVSFIVGRILSALAKTRLFPHGDFGIKGIRGHIPSTAIGFLLLLAIAAAIHSGAATFEQAGPYFIIIIPFLLYGKSGTPPPPPVSPLSPN